MRDGEITNSERERESVREREIKVLFSLEEFLLKILRGHNASFWVSVSILKFLSILAKLFLAALLLLLSLRLQQLPRILEFHENPLQLPPWTSLTPVNSVPTQPLSPKA